MLALPLLVIVMIATTMALTLFTGLFLSISSEQQQPTHQLNEQQLLWIQTVREKVADTEDGVAFWMEGSGNDDFDGADGLYTEYSYADDYIYKDYFKLNNRNNDGINGLLTKHAYDYGPDAVDGMDYA